MTPGFEYTPATCASRRHAGRHRERGAETIREYVEPIRRASGHEPLVRFIGDAVQRREQNRRERAAPGHAAQTSTRERAQQQRAEQPVPDRVPDPVGDAARQPADAGDR